MRCCSGVSDDPALGDIAPHVDDSDIEDAGLRGGGAERSFRQASRYEGVD